MASRSHVTLALVCLGCGLIPTVLARTAQSGEAARSGTTVVMIAERHKEQESKTVIRAVQGQLSDVSVALQVLWVDELPSNLPDQIVRAEEIARDSDAAAVFWCDLDLADRIYLYLAAPRGGRMVVRELSGTGGSGLSEALALIVRSSIEAVLAGGEIGVVVAPRGPDETESVDDSQNQDQEQARLPDQEYRLALLVAYALDMLSSEPRFAHAVALGLEVRLVGPLLVEAGYLLSLPMNERAHDLELTLRRHPAWLGLRVAWLTGDFVLSASVALQIDVVTEEPRSLAAGVAAEGESFEVIPSLVPQLRAGYLLVGHVELFVTAGIDILFRRVTYVIGSPGGSREILYTWPVRPRIMAGLAVGLW